MSYKNEQNKKCAIYGTFLGDADGEYGWGVTGMHGCVVYKATFLRDTAERIAELLNSDTPPKNWNVLQEILIADNYSVADVSQGDENTDFSPGRVGCAAKPAVDNDTYITYRADVESEWGYGVKGILGGEVYEANFYRDTAERIAALMNSPNPPKDYEAIQPILLDEGFSIAVVQRDTPNKEVSPGRAASPLATVRIAADGNISLGSYKVSASLDTDGQLTVVVGSQDNSPVVEIDTEVGCRDDEELGFRFSTKAIENAYNKSARNA